jgi:hypothetical protein
MPSGFVRYVGDVHIMQQEKDKQITTSTGLNMRRNKITSPRPAKIQFSRKETRGTGEFDHPTFEIKLENGRGEEGLLYKNQGLFLKLNFKYIFNVGKVGSNWGSRYNRRCP